LRNTTLDNVSDHEPFVKLLHAIRYDPVISNKVTLLLKMNSYTRRLVLNNWLEELRRKSAPEQLTKSLSSLFDDTIAEKVLDMIKCIKK